MIPVTLAGIPIAYVGIAVAIVLVWWTLRGWLRLRRDGQARRRAIQCALCGAIYENPAKDSPSPCPHCRHRNERIGFSSV